MKDILHIHAQSFWHNPAKIVGTRAGLENLQKALNKVLSSTKESPSAEFTAYPQDGEGYLVEIEIKSEREMEKDPLPYSDRTIMGFTGRNK